jgi:hypothetical protein
MSVFPAGLPNIDPPKHERCWFRHSISGDRGWLVKREGRDMIHLDRVADAVVPKDASWEPDQQKIELTEYQVAQICWDADAKLGYLTGRQKRKDWYLLTEEERTRFVRDGPMGELRQRLWLAIKEAIEHAPITDKTGDQ